VATVVQLFDKHGGFRRLHSFTLATIIHMETLRFCRRFLSYDRRESDRTFYDPKGRQYDQMTQAARSGRQNIIEGSERAATSKDTEIRLTDVARASLSELRGDYEMVILDRNQLPWSVHSPEAKAINAISLDQASFNSDMVHQSARHALEQRKKQVGGHNYFNILTQYILRYSRHKNGRIAPLYNVFVTPKIAE